jgi:hypothetical protein
MRMSIALTVLSGIAWTIVYIEAIRLGFKQRTYAMPIAVLALNIAWESIYSFLDLRDGVSIQGIINVVWVLADIVIVYTFFRFGRAELPGFVTRPMFVSWGVAILGIGFAVQLLFLSEFGHSSAQAYSAFLQNALMSGLFIAMFVARRGNRGQSLLLGVAKWIGTLAPTIAFGIVDEFNLFILGLGIICSVLDLTYIGLLIWARRRPEALRVDAGDGRLVAAD